MGIESLRWEKMGESGPRGGKEGDSILSNDYPLEKS